MISTLIELQRLKGLERTGWMLRGIAPGAESVASHSYGVAVAAMLLADEVAARGVDIDMERVLRVALLHDWAEARVGDMPRTATEYFGAEARKRAERAAFKDIVDGLGAGVRGLDEFWEGISERSLGLDGVAGEVVNEVLRQLLEERQSVLTK